MFASIMASTKACSSVKNEQSRASSSWVILPRIRVRAICASTLGLRSPAMIASSMSRPDTPWMSVITLDSLRWASSSSFSHPCLLSGAGLGQVPPVPGMGAQPPDLLRRHEAGRQRPALGDLRQPHRVQLVGLGRPGQRLDLRGMIQLRSRSPPVPAGSTPASSSPRRLHPDLGHAPAPQPVRQRQQVLADRAERPGLLLPAAAAGYRLGTRMVTITSALPISIPATRSANSGSSSTSSIIGPYDEMRIRSWPSAGAVGKPEIWSAGSKHQFAALKAAPGDQTGGRGQTRQRSTTSADGHAHPGNPPRPSAAGPAPAMAAHRATRAAANRRP